VYARAGQDVFTPVTTLLPLFLPGLSDKGIDIDFVDFRWGFLAGNSKGRLVFINISSFTCISETDRYLFLLLKEKFVNSSQYEIFVYR